MSLHLPTCPSRLRLERVLHGEIDVESDGVLLDHLKSCQRCGSWLAQARLETERLREATDSVAFAERVAARLGGETPNAGRRQRGARWLATRAAPWIGLAAAACLGLVLVVTQTMRQPEPTAAATTRVKGATFFRLHVKRSGRVRLLDPDDFTLPGDAIRFEVFPGPHRYAMVASLQGDGSVLIYAPFDGQTSLSVSPDRSLILAGSVVLEGLDDELLLLLLTDEPVAVKRVRRAVAAAYRRASGRLSQVHGLDLPATVHLWLLRRGGG